MAEQQLPFEDEEELIDRQQLRADQRRHGLDPVVETAAGRVCWASELTPEEEAAGYRVRRDLATPRDPPF